MRVLTALVPLCLVVGACGPSARTGENAVLFVRGGPGTGGLVSGGDEQLSSIDDTSTAPGNAGWGELRANLESAGFVVRETIERGGPIDLDAVDIGTYAVIVFGSNNARYSDDAAARLDAWVRDGGGALFVSDASFGSSWGAAPSSDQTFLSRFDLVMNQDGANGVVTLSGADFLAPQHSVLSGVSAFEGEGVSACSITDHVADVAPVRLVAAKADVRANAGEPGPLAAPTDRDASLAVAQVGKGRVACHFDRSTFFNAGGAGTSIRKAGNAKLATNLFLWLANRT
ncbi:MAG: hypothetical protein JWM74_2359 [Myxococcaceae bacterium]|nr:hypothetical protein [Myxococcaceae bacterium]